MSIEVTVTPLQEVGDELAERMHELLHTLPPNEFHSLEWNAVDAEYDADVEGQDSEGSDFDDSSDDDADCVFESDDDESFECLRCFW